MAEPVPTDAPLHPPAVSTVSTLPPEAEFDPLEFWIRHRGKILLYGGLLAAALLIYGIYELARQRTAQAAQRAYASAKSAEDFRRVLTDYPRTVPGANAHLMLADKLRGEGKPDEAIATLRTFIDQHPDHPLISGAHASLAASQEAAGKLDEALATFQKVATSYPTSFSAPGAWIGQGRIFKAQGKMDEAKRAYETVKTQFAESLFANEAQQELQSLGK